ncbi:MAG: ATP-binding protein [Campylobacterota bacterium]|nr:ATP-binding protein [Campylobacterota bacterium]
MKKPIIVALIFTIVLIFLAYNKHDTKEKIENYFIVSNKIGKIYTINNNFDLFLSSIDKYNNFDIVQNDVISVKNDLNYIITNRSIENLKGLDFHKKLNLLQEDIDTKINIIQKVKSYNAILNNSFRYLQKIKSDTTSKELDRVFVVLLTLSKNSEIDLSKEINKISDIKVSSKVDKKFLQHVKIFFNYYKNLKQLLELSNSLELNKNIDEIISIYDILSHENITKAHIIVSTLFILLILSVILFLYDSYNIFKKQKELNRFKNTIENSDNVVVITNFNQEITYVNRAFTQSTGYSYKEAIGKKPSILQSGSHTKEFYKELNETIYSGKKWMGTFINIVKDGHKQYERSSITPVLNDKGEIIEFIAIKLDITKEIEAQNSLRQKEQIMMHQSKMASMGEMLTNIAHQWRQPLSMISTAATGVSVQKTYDILTDDILFKSMDDINNSVQYLSNTIEDFRDYFKPNKEKVKFDIETIIDKSLKLIESDFKNINLEVVKNIEKIELYGLPRELIQVVMNILKNCKDILKEKNIEDKVIKINIIQKDSDVFISIHDNGGGVPNDIIEKIFEPYFTTKHQSQGTGIGLYMSYEIITKHMNGYLEVLNESIDYKENEYIGANFKITIPKLLK